MGKSIKQTVIKFDQRIEEDFKEPSRYYIVDAMGDYIYFHCRERSTAQAEVDEIYGKNKYLIRSGKMEKGSGEYTCTGSNTRRGFSAQLRPTV